MAFVTMPAIPVGRFLRGRGRSLAAGDDRRQPRIEGVIQQHHGRWRSCERCLRRDISLPIYATGFVPPLTVNEAARLILAEIYEP
jgi:hypothetical protein